jgi:uncharacterized protein YjgD (DUF1641 family)
MASPISFKPQPFDPHQELMKRVDAAPREHAEALLVAWDLLQTAHDKGILDLAQGLIGGRDVIAGKLAEAGKSDEGVAALRNALAVGRILAAFDPDMLQRMAKSFEADGKALRVEKKPPSLWQLFRRVTSEDGRRGIGFVTALLAKVGAATHE